VALRHLYRASDGRRPRPNKRLHPTNGQVTTLFRKDVEGRMFRVRDSSASMHPSFDLRLYVRNTILNWRNQAFAAVCAVSSLAPGRAGWPSHNSHPNNRINPVAGKSGTRNVASRLPATLAMDCAA
jgi:hypothetical protein